MRRVPNVVIMAATTSQLTNFMSTSHRTGLSAKPESSAFSPGYSGFASTCASAPTDNAASAPPVYQTNSKPLTSATFARIYAQFALAPENPVCLKDDKRTLNSPISPSVSGIPPRTSTNRPPFSVQTPPSPSKTLFVFLAQIARSA